MKKYPYTIGKKCNLKEEQEKTLTTPRLRANFFLWLLFITFDLFYGKKGSFPKVKVLEILARYPYWAWENGGYHRLTKNYARKGKADTNRNDTFLMFIAEGRSAQDNEQLHMMIVEDIIHQRGIKLGWLKHFIVPRILAFGYYYFTRFLFFIKPKWSFYMNAAFESHAEHEYMLLSKEHPEWDKEPVETPYFKCYPKQPSLGDLIRRIALDERDHMYHSLEIIDFLDRKKQ